MRLAEDGDDHSPRCGRVGQCHRPRPHPGPGRGSREQLPGLTRSSQAHCSPRVRVHPKARFKGLCPVTARPPRYWCRWRMLEASRGLELCEEEPESFELNLTAGQLAAVDLTDSLGTFEAGNAPYHLPFLQSASKPPPQLPRPLPPPPMRRHRQHHRHRPATPPPHQHQSPSSPSSHSCLHLCSITWSVRESFAQRCNVELSSWVPARRLKAPSPELCSLRLVGRVPARCL